MSSRDPRCARRLSCLTLAVAALCGFAVTQEVKASTQLFDFSTGSQGFTAGGTGPAWTYTGSQWQVGSSSSVNSSTLTSTMVNVAFTGDVSLSLAHTFNFEDTFDGGQLRVSVNGGAFNLVNPFTANGYTRTISVNFGSPIAGQRAWSGSGGPETSTADLGTLTGGTTLQFQWLAAWDESLAATAPNWQLTSFSLALPDLPAAFWTGDQDSVWSTNNAGNTNWATTLAGTTDTATLPVAATDVTFSASNVTSGSQNTTLGQDFTIHSLTINDPAAVTIGGANTLTVSGGGVTVNSGAGLFTVNANLTLAGASNTITVNNAAGAVINGVLGGTVGLTKAGTGTLTLNNANTYTGGTTLNAGTLILGNSAALGGAAGGLLTINGGTIGSNVDFVTLNNAVLVNADFSTTRTGAASSFGFNGAVDLGGGTRTITNLSGGNTAFFQAIGNGTGLTLASAAGTPSLFQFISLGVVNNTYTGTTTLNGPTTLVLARGAGTNAIPGDLVLNDNSKLNVNVSEQIVDTSNVTLNGTSELVLLNGATETIATLNSTSTLSTVDIQSGKLVLNSATNASFAGTIVSVAAGSLVKNGTNAVTLTGSNNYLGGTTINAGTLLANNTAGSATGPGPVVINAGGTLGGNGTAGGAVTLNSGGFIAPGAAATGISTATLHLGSLTWNSGGQLNLQLGTTSDLLAVTGALTKVANKEGGGAYTLQITDAGGIGDQTTYTLATFASTTFAAGDFTLTLPAGFSAALLETGTELDLVLAFAASGPVIQNAAPVNTPKIADFTIIGPVTTGGPLDNNTINSLLFTPGGTLTIFNILTVTSGSVTTTGGTNSITGGALFGPNGLHFDVFGDLFIGSTLIGNTIKTGPGSLFLDGALYGDLSVLQGLLGGNGLIFGNLFNAGIVSPGHSPGEIHVTGNYTQTSSGVLRVEIGGRSQTKHDLLSVGGTATLDGTLQLVRLDNYKLKRNKPVTFLTAEGGVMGRFAAVQDDFTSDTILQPTVVYHAHSVDLEAVQGSFEEFAQRWGLTPNQKSVARALDSAAHDRRADPIFNHLDYRKLNKLPGDFDKIAPEELTSIAAISTAYAHVQSLNFQRRTDDIRSGSSGFSAAGLAINGSGPSYSGNFGATTTGAAGPSGKEGKESKESKEVQQVAPAENKWGVFLSGTGEWVSVGNTDNARGYDLDSGGFTLGVDYKVCPNFAIGLAAGYTGTTADLTDRGRVWTNGGKLGLYATTFVGGWYADVAAFGGYNNYSTRRGALQGEARGETDGGEIDALFGTGYDFKVGRLTFGPTATFNYTYVGMNGFTESGSLVPLDIHSGKTDSLRSAIGFKASYDWRVGGLLIKPEIRAAWQHEYGDTAYDLTSNFANGAGNAFLVNGPQLGRDSALLGAGFAIQCSERCATYFYYDGELGRRNYQATNVTGGLRLSF